MIILKKGLVAVGLLLVMTGTTYVLLPGDNENDKHMVYTAKKNLPAGEFLTEKDLIKREVNEKFEWMVTDLKQVSGKVPQQNIISGRFLDKTNFEKDMPVIYEENEGEYTIKTKTEYVNGGNVDVGDVVDVIYTQQSKEAGSDRGQLLAENLVVVSVRTQDAEDIETAKEKKKNPTPYAVTLKMDVQNAQDLAWGQETGTLSLFLKNAGRME